MLIEQLTAWLSDAADLPSAGLISNPITAGELDPNGRYLLGMNTPIAHDPIRVKGELRKLGKVASFKYILGWPDGMQVYMVMPKAGVAAGQYLNAARPFCSVAGLFACQHPIFYSLQWDTSADVEQSLEGWPIRNILIVAAVVVVLLIVVNVNVEA